MVDRGTRTRLVRAWLAVLLSSGVACKTGGTGGGGPPPRVPATAQGPAPARDQAAEAARALAERSPIVVRGRIRRTSASDEPMLAASPSTVVASVQKMYAGARIAGDQAGRQITVILSRPDPRLKDGADVLFFGAPRFIGTSLTIADAGEVIADGNAPAIAAAVERGVRVRRNGPLLRSLAGATLVFRGTVQAVRPLGPGPRAAATRPPREPSEHDPEWHLATVRVTTPLRGGAPGDVVNVIFPASRDIAWFAVPKLQPAEDAVFVTHALSGAERARYREPALVEFLSKQPAHFILRPADVQPVPAESRVRALLSGDREVP